jgi:choline dehydrogenase
MSEAFDFVIVGAGSAGCVLADRLSADGRHSVLVIESGGSHRRFFVDMPLGYGKLFHDDSLNWSYTTEPDAHRGGATDYWPRGRILGGSSSINAMVYIRGQQEDYNDWARLGNQGWGFADVLPYFLKSEDNDLGASALHGVGGQLKVSSIERQRHPSVAMAIEAARTLGYPVNPDFNGTTQEGFGLYQFTFRNGRRCSNAVAFLERAMRRRNVTVVTQATVRRIVFKGRRAIGVEYLRNGEVVSALARREVLLAAGAINSPMVLQQSGVGPGALLQSLGVGVVHANEAVGANLQDHGQVGLAFRTKGPTLNNTLSSAHGKLWAGIQYVMARRGPLSLSVNQAGAFIRTRAELTRPDSQLYILPLSFRTNPSKEDAGLELDNFGGMIMTASPCRPQSRGSVRIRSTDVHAAPEIRANYLSTEDDIRVMVDSLKVLQRLACARPLAEIIARRERPQYPLDTDEQLAAHALANCKTTYHPSCTCTMGVDPHNSVVDPQLRVHGLEHLRVIDASVMPLLVSGNTNAAATMIGEKGADLVRTDHP